MAMQKSTINIPLNAPINTKVDEKDTSDTIFLKAENCRYKKIGSITKRFGYVKQDLSLIEDAPIDLGSDSKKLASDSSQVLLLGQKGKASQFFWRESQGKFSRQDPFRKEFNNILATFYHTSSPANPCSIDVISDTQALENPYFVDNDSNEDYIVSAACYGSQLASATGWGPLVGNLRITTTDIKTGNSKTIEVVNASESVAKVRIFNNTAFVFYITGQSGVTNFILRLQRYNLDNLTPIGSLVDIGASVPNLDPIPNRFDVAAYGGGYDQVTYPNNVPCVVVVWARNQVQLNLRAYDTLGEVSYFNKDTAIPDGIVSNIDLIITPPNTNDEFVDGLTEPIFRAFYIATSFGFPAREYYVDTSFTDVPVVFPVNAYTSVNTALKSPLIFASYYDSADRIVLILDDMEWVSSGRAWQYGIRFWDLDYINFTQDISMHQPRISCLTKIKRDSNNTIVGMVKSFDGYLTPIMTYNPEISRENENFGTFTFGSGLVITGHFGRVGGARQLSAGDVVIQNVSQNFNLQNSEFIVSYFKEKSFLVAPSISSSPINASLASRGSIKSIKINIGKWENGVCNFAKLGSSIYNSGGFVGMSGGDVYWPAPFINTPSIVTVTTASATSEALPVGTYQFCVVYEFINSAGERFLSHPSNIVSQVIAANQRVQLRFFLHCLTAPPKGYTFNFLVYMTDTGGSVLRFCRKASINPDISAIPSVPLVDNFDRLTSLVAEALYTTGNVLPNDCAPPSRFICSHNERLFSVDAEEKDLISYTKKKKGNFGAEFSDFFKIRVTSSNVLIDDRIIGLGSLGDKLAILKNYSIWYTWGDGPNDLGFGGIFSDPELLSSDVGCISPNSIIKTPIGLLFQSAKGIYNLSDGMQLSYIGNSVEAFNDDLILSSTISEIDNIVTFAQEDRLLIYDYLIDRWSVDTIGATSIAHWQGQNFLISGDQVARELEVYYDDIDGVEYVSMKVTTGWIKATGKQDYARFWRAMILGKFKSSHILTMRVYYDYSDTDFDEYQAHYLAATSDYQSEFHLKRQKCQSIKFEVFDSRHDLADNNTIGEHMELNDLSLMAGVKQGLNKKSKERKG